MSKSSIHRLERGQALAEYHVLFPVAIAIMIAGASITHWINQSLLKTNEGLQRGGQSSQICDNTSDSDEGPSSVQLDNHFIQLIASSYNSATNETTVVYKVTSGDQPSISHWVLGLPKAMSDRIVSVSEQSEWTNSDPTTLVAGVKFDTGYEGTGSGGSGGSGGNGGGNGNGGGKGGKSASALQPGTAVAMQSTYRAPRFGRPHQTGSGSASFSLTGDAREISMVLSGAVEFSSVEVAIKAGTEVHIGTISAPVALAESSNQTGGTDDLYEGCSK